MTKVFKLCDEEALMSDLLKETFSLIKQTKGIGAVKKLVEIHDVFALNAEILNRFKESDLTFDEIWMDLTTLKFLNRLRCELFVYHGKDFENLAWFNRYNKLFARFINLVILRQKNGYEEINEKIVS